MKTLKLAFIITLFSVFGRDHLYCQITDWDTTYTTTVLYDDFSTSQLDMNKWSVEDNSYTANGVIIDSSATVSVNSGKLKLSVISCIDCSRAGETRNLAGGEVFTNERLQYGIIECSAKINISEASMPDFSFIGGNGNDCANGNYYASEVNIFRVVEPAVYPTELQQNILHHHPDTDCKLKYTKVNYDFEQIRTSLNDFFDYYHTYKCVWTPNYIRYYVDGDLKHEVTNTGAECPICNQNWFPAYPSQVHLCNKVGGNMYYTYYSSTYFDWVRVKEFFQTPEITCPDVICSTGTAVLDVDPLADSITWALTPSALFSGATTGTGKTASITGYTGISAQGKITYSFKMPSDEIFTAEKTFSIGPNASDFTVYVEEQYGDPVPGSPDGPFEVCDNTSYWICLYPYFLYDENHINDVDFDFNFGNYDVLYQGNDYIVIHIDKIYEEGYGEIYVDTDCGYVTLKFLEFVEGCGYYLMFTPNPSNYETTVSIETTSTGKKIDTSIEWELEVYSESQLLKEKKTKLKGKSTKIQTQGWKEGTYIARVKYEDEVLQGKLIVKN